VLVRNLTQSERDAMLSTGRLPGRVKTHDLLRLVKDIGFAATASDEHLLRRLERAAVWAGRYPVGLSHDDRVVATLPSGGVDNLTKRSSQDVDAVRALIKRIEAIVRSR
jgi:hypothetical protein